ncbi:MAG TPA: metallophosphoesterase family protein [Burkholderiaceae bacterium]
MTTRIGVISDTHGLLRPEALDFLQGSECIVHAGDIGSLTILKQLEEIAPLIVVRGNNDREPWGLALPERALFSVESVQLYVVHDIADLDLMPSEAAIQIVISGHSHKPSLRVEDGVTWLNPGSAGRRRFKLPIALAEILVDGADSEAHIAHL